MNQLGATAASGKILARLNESTINENVPAKSQNSISRCTMAPGTKSAEIKGQRILKVQWLLTVGLLLAGLVPAQGQVLATQRAGFGLPANQVPAPNTPGGGVVVGSFFYAT